MVLSPSSIRLFLECPRCFWLDKIRKIKRPAGAFPSLPSGMDRVLKEHFDCHRAENTVPEELAGKFQGKLFPDIERLKIWRNNFRGLTFTDIKSGIILRGAIDDLFITSNNLYASIDFKTRGFPRKEDTHEYYQHQMDIYSLLLEKNAMQPAGFAILIFYHPVSVDSKHNVIFDPDPLELSVNKARGEQIFRDAIKCLLGRHEPEAAKDCPFCKWYDEVSKQKWG